MNDIAYSEYTVSISVDPIYYGDECSTTDAIRIAKNLTDMIVAEFPGITVLGDGAIGSSGVTGPDESMCEEVRVWVQDNWTAAL
jgi:hypothetical protein